MATHNQNLDTKVDALASSVEELKQVVKAQGTEFRAALGDQRAEFQAGFADQRAEFRAALGDQRAEFQAGFAEQRAEFRAALGEMDTKFSRALAEQREDLKSYVGVLFEETNSKLDLIIEVVTATNERLDREIEEIRKEIEELHMILFRKADLDRLKVLEQRVGMLEQKILEMK